MSGVLGRATRMLVRGLLCALALLLAGPITGQARGVRQVPAASPSPVSLGVSVGYGNIYRGTAWTPVHVTVRNGTGADLNGTLEIPQSAQGPSLGGSASFHGLFQAPLLVPAGSTKHVTLYVPGSGVQGQLNATFRQGNRTLASASAYPMGIDSSALLVGAITGSAGDAAWIVPAIQQNVTAHVVTLDATTIDAVPQALASFDILVLTNVDSSQLDRAQLAALEGFVRNGGSLLLVGGASWQETLRPLPAALLPGRLTGMRNLPDLHGLGALGSVPRSARSALARGAAAVSVLSHPEGAILAGQAGIPLVVRKSLGQGVVEYLAFDPALDPVRSWTGGGTASGVLEHILASAAPMAISRTWSPQGFRSRFRRAFSSLALTGELANLPPATLPLLALFAALTLGYVLILGPANFLLLRRIHRQHLAWITIPALALSYLGSSFGISTHLRGSAAQVNSIGMVTLNGAAGHQYPATVYLGLVAPLPGDYHLTYDAPALPAPIQEISRPNGFFWRGASTLHSTPLGLRLQEGSPTEVTFLAMKRWSMRDVTLNTTVHLPGTVGGNLAIDARGDISGLIHNGTNLDLLDPVLVAGQTVVHLPDISAGGTVRAHIQPSIDATSQDQSSLWSQLYGGDSLGGDDGFGGFRGCCDQFSFPQENQLVDRLRNVTAMLSQEQTLSTLGEVFLVGWSEKPLDGIRVDGSAPQRRDLNAIMAPLSVHFPSHGAFSLRNGTIGARLVDLVPRAPQSSCCGFFSRNDQQISVGAGGSLTFEFDLPGGGHLRFNRLELAVNSSDEGTGAGAVYDWRAHRWVHVDVSSGSVDLPRPSRFVASSGQIMVKLQATSGSGDMTIDNPYQDVQISGAGDAA